MTNLKLLQLGYSLSQLCQPESITYTLLDRSRSGKSVEVGIFGVTFDYSTSRPNPGQACSIVDLSNCYVRGNNQGITLARYLNARIVSDKSQWRLNLSADNWRDSIRQIEKLPVLNLTRMEAANWLGNPEKYPYANIPTIYPFKTKELT